MKFFYLIAALVMVNISGCASVHSVQRNQTLPENSGMFVLHVASAMAAREKMIRPGNIQDNWHAIDIMSVSENKHYSIRREGARRGKVDEFPGTAHFSAALPPGVYRVTELMYEGLSSPSYVRRLSAPISNQLGTFHIEAGRITDLGTIVYYPAKWDGTGKFRIFKAPPSAATIEAVKHKNPVVHRSAGAYPYLGWDSSEGVLDGKALDTIANHLPRLNPMFESQSGDIYAGGMLGQILHRDRSGTWTTENSGVPYEIYQITESGDGTLYALGERTLLKREKKSRTWTAQALPDAPGPLEFFRIEPDGTQYLYMFTDDGILNGYTLFTRHSGEVSWNVAAQAAFDNGFADAAIPTEYRVAGDEFHFFLYRCDYGFHGGSSIVKDCPGIGMFTAARYLDDGILYGAQQDYELRSGGRSGMDAIMVFYDTKTQSFDERFRWEGSHIKDIWFTDPANGFALVSNSTLLANLFETEFQRTTDGGRTWQAVSKLPPESQSLHVTKDGTILAITTIGTVYASRDQGNTWQLERSRRNLLSPARSAESIQIVFDRHKNAIYEIYKRELKNNKTLRGHMVLRIVIETSGVVSSCHIESSELNSPALEANIMNYIGKMNFGANKDAPKTTIIYPIDFLPAT